VYTLDDLPGKHEFLALTSAAGVLEVARVGAHALYIFLGRELWPEEVWQVRGKAHRQWPLDNIVLAVRADLKVRSDGKCAG